MYLKRILLEVVVFILGISGLISARGSSKSLILRLYYTDGTGTTCKSFFSNLTAGGYVGNVPVQTVGGTVVNLYTNISQGTCVNQLPTNAICLRP